MSTEQALSVALAALERIGSTTTSDEAHIAARNALAAVVAVRNIPAVSAATLGQEFGERAAEYMRLVDAHAEFAQQVLAALAAQMETLVSWNYWKERAEIAEEQLAPNTLTDSEIIKLICDHTGLRISLREQEIWQHVDYARAVEARLIGGPIAGGGVCGIDPNFS